MHKTARFLIFTRRAYNPSDEHLRRMQSALRVCHNKHLIDPLHTLLLYTRRGVEPVYPLGGIEIRDGYDFYSLNIYRPMPGARCPFLFALREEFKEK